MFGMNARNRLKSLAMLSDSESKVEPFITKTKAALMAVLQLSFRKTILNLHLPVQTTSKQLTISIFAPRIFWLTCLQMKKIPVNGVVLYITDKETQSRNEARIPQNTKRSTTLSTRVWDDWVKERDALPWQRHFRSSSKPWNFKTLLNFEL